MVGRASIAGSVHGIATPCLRGGVAVPVFARQLDTLGGLHFGSADSTEQQPLFDASLKLDTSPSIPAS